jgi:hypothetical protein
MATLEVSGDELVLRLSRWERLGALHGDVRVPRRSVRAPGKPERCRRRRPDSRRTEMSGQAVGAFALAGRGRR